MTKALAILSVLVLHAVPRHALESSFAIFHVWQAVPVFAVLLGVSAVHTRISPIRAYLTRRALRLLPAFAVAWVASLTLGVLLDEVYRGPLLALGLLPHGGPGNYYITLMLQFVLLLPILKRIFDRTPRATLVGSFAVALAFELTAGSTSMNPYLYASCVVRYLPAIVLGMWIESGHRAWPGMVVSLPYLVAHAAGLRIDAFVTAWQPQNLLAFFYPATLVEFALGSLPVSASSMVARPAREIGKASYHIFLVQMLWFGGAIRVLPFEGIARVLIGMTACTLAGIVFARVDTLAFASLRKRFA